MLSLLNFSCRHLSPLKIKMHNRYLVLGTQVWKEPRSEMTESCHPLMPVWCPISGLSNRQIACSPWISELTLLRSYREGQNQYTTRETRVEGAGRLHATGTAHAAREAALVAAYSCVVGSPIWTEAGQPCILNKLVEATCFPGHKRQHHNRCYFKNNYSWKITNNIFNNTNMLSCLHSFAD